METPTPWHRLFGIALTDLFTGRPWRVEVEKELALKSQRLDILIIEREASAGLTAGPGALAGLPDGLEGLATHNLLTYKSQHQPLDAWALDELLGHFVTYRKLVSIERTRQPSLTPDGAGPPRELTEPTPGSYRLLPEADFGLYAVATRTPEKLLAQIPASDLTATPWPGVLDLRWGGRTVRLIFLGQIAADPRNAPWEIFSARLDRVRHGLLNYHPYDPLRSDLLAQLYFTYRLEVPDMAYTIEDFKRDTLRLRIAHLHELDSEDIQAIVDQFPIEARLRGLDSKERLRGLDPEERLRGLDPAIVEEWLKRRGH
ncbi:hypothetical protein [uncultured Thiodictyon sp.]|jgi:hypothetical protein|uniref:hypothetical protein n=1 Tax=uncultured Thiodictyon sp. TaxID=1846217 RepID=UPI0025DC3808|nr:hypothetical protein [uncultured Thiodictyon sp.]